MEEMVQIVSNMGFPIVTSLYLLIRIEGKLEELTLSIRSLSQAITKFEA